MKILFMGTPDFARTILAALHEGGHEIAAVVTQPDKPQGRKRILTPPPVKVYAAEAGIPVYQPATMKDGAFTDTLAEIDPEVIVVAAYGKILPPYILDYPKYGCINAHASLLPRHRGAAPIQRAILAGDTVTGVTAMYMAEGLDTGDMILKAEVSILPEDNFETLHDKLAEAGARCMLDTLTALQNGTAVRIPQTDADSTYAAKIENADCALTFDKPLLDVYNHIRALSPVLLAVTTLPDGRTLKLLAAQMTDKQTDEAPGTVVSTDGGKIAVACADGVIAITGVQPEGKAKMDAASFVNGRGIAVGDRLTPPQYE
ncbi:MAG: methionyl-tRNA formyltransferase [Clostridia bacterium]|nr:methionyl-tRNA formyltransferase [Clostridia bacterium]